MSGAVKSGLLFLVVGIVAVVGFSFIPLVGALLCGPLAAALVGMAAGYFAVRWGRPESGIGAGVGAGALAGIGTLLGSVLFWVVMLMIAQSMPEFQNQVTRSLQQQQPNSEISAEQMTMLISVMGPLIGFCFGVLNMLLTLGLGALGAWIAVRQRQKGTPVIPNEPLGPPPMSPTSF